MRNSINRAPARTMVMVATSARIAMASRFSNRAGVLNNRELGNGAWLSYYTVNRGLAFIDLIANGFVFDGSACAPSVFFTEGARRGTSTGLALPVVAPYGYSNVRF